MAIAEEHSQHNHSKKEYPEPGSWTNTHFATVFDSMPVGVLGFDGSGIITYANQSLAAICGLSINQLVGKQIFSVLAVEESGEEGEGVLKLEHLVDDEFQIRSSHREIWTLVSSGRYPDAGGSTLNFLFIRDISRVKKKEKLFSYLNHAATALASTRDTKTALDQISKFIVPKFADWFTIDLVKEGQFELLLLKHEDPNKIKWAYNYRKNYPPDINANSGAALVVKIGNPIFVPVITENMIDASITDPIQRQEIRKIGLGAFISMPLFARERIAGVVNFISSSSNRPYDEADLEFAHNFVNLISLALENARLNEAATAELDLRKQSEENFRFLTDAIPNKLWTSGPDGRATYYNQQWYEYTGITNFEELRGKIWDHIHPDDRAIAAVEWPKAIKNDKPMEMEHRFMRSDGEYRWHLSRFSGHKDQDGKTILWVGTSTDVHEQRVAGMDLAAANEELSAANEELAAMNEEAATTVEEIAATNEELAATNEELINTQSSLARSEKLFRSIALNIPKSVIIVIDRDHRYRVIEGDIMERMGYDRKAYEGKHPAEISPERYEASKDLYDRVIGGEKFSVERKAETGENYMVHFVPLRDADNEVEAGLILALDITDIKQAEEKSAKLAAIVESSDDAIISKTLDSVITSWNQAAENMFGYSAQEIIGQTIYKIIPPDRHNEELSILERLKKGEHVQHYETKRLRSDGSLLDVSLTISPLLDSSGNIIGVSKIARDITEKKLEEQRKNDFIGMVSHELKTPLTSLSAILQLTSIKLTNADTSFLSKAMERANVQVKKMTKMINGFLDISRLEAGKILIEKQYFDVEQLIKEIFDETRLIVSTHNLKLLGCKSVEVYADRDKIGSVISNLIGNAIKYSPSGKTIEIDCQARDHEVTISIKDEGMGIKPQDVEQIFDRYYRVETVNTRHISGFGIGLYLSAEIIRRHDGKIWVESTLGQGSTFYFTLPLVTDK